MQSTRRELIATFGTFSAVAALGMPSTALASPDPDAPYRFFSPREGVTLRALISALIPDGGEGPGGLAAGCDRFLDQALGGAYGAGAGQYLGGPTTAGEPTQGYQLSLDPAQFYRIALADTHRHALTAHGAAFSDLTSELRAGMLADMQSGKADFETIPAPLWFGTLWFDVQCGYFSDPIYGGNRDMAAWRHVGFPGAVHEFRRYLGSRAPVRVPPVGLSQLVQERRT